MPRLILALSVAVGCGGASPCEEAADVRAECDPQPSTSTGTPVEGTVEQCDEQAACAATCVLDAYDGGGCTRVNATGPGNDGSLTACLGSCILSADTGATSP